MAGARDLLKHIESHNYIVKCVNFATWLPMVIWQRDPINPVQEIDENDTVW